MAAKAKWQSVWRNGENNRNKHQWRKWQYVAKSIMAGENNGDIENVGEVAVSMAAKWRRRNNGSGEKHNGEMAKNQ
jgi:hypothetical protein